ncbi:DUF4097 family beta strand repeat-containing protein [Alkalibacillus salilacus]|uniref:DUF4097 and DUF4098 domain-containing protein YvlB n=1 Tax=Alkalibacillus salilacus TaxID=284582 RepID=A0ABT9VF76_9BACI|nr:DUF4097 family beta strand repeat-containing protein [Alkalibacillus salilacus]MDQ0159628.1 DUF4097 and DUF4098 domain-containing protein YvlB [Alkalibacillus salilacus]
MSASRRKILELLEEGHITSEEADEMLNELENSEQKKANQQTTEGQSESGSSNFGKRFKRDMKQLAEGLGQFVGDAVQRVNPKEVNRLFHFDDHAVKNVSVGWQNGAINVQPSEDHVIKVKLAGKVFNQTDANEAQNVFDEAVNVMVQDDQLSLEQSRKDMYVNATIYLPETTYEQMQIETVSGSVKLFDHKSQEVNVQTVNGSVKLQGYEADQLKSGTRHGSVKCDDVSCETAKLETVVGSVHFDGEANELDVDVVTGTAKVLIDEENAKRVDINVTTGTILLHVPDDLRVNGRAYTSWNSVDIGLNNVTVQELGEQKAKRQTQFFHSESEKPRCDVQLSTKTGQIKVKQS